MPLVSLSLSVFGGCFFLFNPKRTPSSPSPARSELPPPQTFFPLFPSPFQLRFFKWILQNKYVSSRSGTSLCPFPSRVAFLSCSHKETILPYFVDARIPLFCIGECFLSTPLASFRFFVTASIVDCFVFIFVWCSFFPFLTEF